MEMGVQVVHCIWAQRLKGAWESKRVKEGSQEQNSPLKGEGWAQKKLCTPISQFVQSISSHWFLHHKSLVSQKGTVMMMVIYYVVIYCSQDSRETVARLQLQVATV